MSEGLRNFLILLLLALVGLMFSGAFNFGTGVAFFVLNILFVLSILAMLVLAYWRNRGTIALMPPRARLQLHLAGGGVLFVVVTGALFPGWSSQSGLLSLVFFMLLGLGAFGIWHAWQQRYPKW